MHEEEQWGCRCYYSLMLLLPIDPVAGIFLLVVGCIFHNSCWVLKIVKDIDLAYLFIIIKLLTFKLAAMSMRYFSLGEVMIKR